MAKGFKHGPGGTSLNFDVKRYNSEAELLASVPKENTIGVVTTEKISSWAFSSSEPAEPSEGMVWFYTNENSTLSFNALKKNTIQLHPSDAKQYVSGSWVDKDLSIYHGNEWVSAVIYLLKDGEAVEFSFGREWEYAGYATFDGTDIYMKAMYTAAAETDSVRATTSSVQPTASKNTLIVTYKNFYASDDNAKFTVSLSGASASISRGSNGSGKITLDISKVNQDSEITFNLFTATGTSEIYISEIKLE